MTRALRTCTDPTREEMMAYLASLLYASEFDDFDREEAIYWFASGWHGGQWSSLYAALSTSPFNPGMTQRKPSEVAAILYDALEAHYAVHVVCPA